MVHIYADNKLKMCRIYKESPKCTDSIMLYEHIIIQ